MSRYMVVSAHLSDTENLDELAAALAPLKAEGTIGQATWIDVEQHRDVLIELLECLGLNVAAQEITR